MMLLILMQPDAGTFVVFTSFLWVFYREGISYDFIISGLLRLIPFVDHNKIKIGSNFEEFLEKESTIRMAPSISV